MIDSDRKPERDIGDERLDRHRGTRKPAFHPWSRLHARHWMLVAVTVLLVGAGVGAGGQVAGWWEDASAPAPDVNAIRQAFGKPEMDPATGLQTGRMLSDKVDFARARTVARAPGVALVAVPRIDGGYCLTLWLGADPDVAIACDEGSSDPQDLFLSWSIAKGEEPIWVIVGRVTDPNAATVSVSDLHADVAGGGFFMARVPAERWSQLSGVSGVLAVLDSGGHTIRESCVTFGAPPDTSPTGGVSVAASDLTDAPPCEETPLG